MLPIFDIIGDKIPLTDLKDLINNDSIRTIPLAFLRGITFRKSFVVIDEAQNVTPEQMRLILTRIGERTKIVCAGDITQSDIRVRNGLTDAIKRFGDMKNVGIVQMTAKSIVRSPLIAEIEERYNKKV